MALQIIASKKLSEELLGLDAYDFDFADEIAKLHDALENPPKIPTTAAEIKRQYLLRDYGIQTDQTEILDMKHLQDLNEALVSDLHDLRYEASLTEKHIQQMGFEFHERNGVVVEKLEFIHSTDGYTLSECTVVRKGLKKWL